MLARYSKTLRECKIHEDVPTKLLHEENTVLGLVEYKVELCIGSFSMSSSQKVIVPPLNIYSNIMSISLLKIKTVDVIFCKDKHILAP